MRAIIRTNSGGKSVGMREVRLGIAAREADQPREISDRIFEKVLDRNRHAPRKTGGLRRRITRQDQMMRRRGMHPRGLQLIGKTRRRNRKRLKTGGSQDHLESVGAI